MKRTLVILFLVCHYSAVAQTAISDFVNFLKQENLSPKEYVLDLFKTNDIVIIGERDHRDTTQYDLILDILGDKRFIDQVGYVYTEVGVVNRTEWANRVLKNDYLTQSEFEIELIKLYRELDFNPLWDRYNMYKYLKGIYRINKDLSPNKKITVGLTDCEFDWNGMTAEKYKNFTKVLLKRDSIMAANFIKLFEFQVPINGTRKALLIQSQPHAIKLGSYPNSKSTGRYITEKYGQKVKIVLFNWYSWVPPDMHLYPWIPDKENRLTADGKWDAAFELSGLKPVGFNLIDSPFGETLFNYAPDSVFNYQKIADGLIYFVPFYEFQCTIGIPNVVDKHFAKELVDRDIMTYDKWLKRFGMKLIKPILVKKEKDYYNNVRTVNCQDYEKLKIQMNKWLTK